MPPLARLLTITLALRLAVPAAAWLVSGGPDVFLTSDSAQYLSLARSLAEDGRYFRDGRPELHRTPGYPLLIAFGVALGHPVFFTLVLQAFLGTATVALVHRTILDVSRDARAALAGGIACAAEPVQMVWDSRLMAEALLTTCVALCAWALLRDLAKPSRRWLGLTGIGAVLAAYAKPIALFLPLWLAATWIVSRRGFARATLLFVLCVGGLLPWVVRNEMVGGYAGFSTTLDRVTAFRVPIIVKAAREGRTYADLRDETGTEFDVPQDPEQRAAARRRGLAALRAAPGVSLLAHATGIVRTLFHPGALPLLTLAGRDVRAISSEVLHRGSRVGLTLARASDPVVLSTGVLLTAILFVYLLLAALALFRTPATSRSPRLVLAGLILYFLLLSGGPWGQSRFRHPIMPLMSVLCGLAIADSRTRSERTSALTAARTR